MDDLPDELLDAMMARHADAQLGPHVGRPSRWLAAELARERRWRLARRIAGAAVAAAAVIAVALVNVPRTQTATTEGRGAQPNIPLDAPGQLVQTAWSTPDGDDGETVLLEDGKPARKLVRHGTEVLTWTDATGKYRIKAVVPVDDVWLVGVRTY